MAGVGNIQVGNNPLWERRWGAGGSIGVTTTNGLLWGGSRSRREDINIKK